MTDFEKIEKLRQHADVTFEEAKQALDAVGGDILDAMIWLEQRGKVKGPSESVHSTKYEDQQEYVSVDETVKQNAGNEHRTGAKVTSGFKRIWNFFAENFFIVSRNDREIVVLPLLLVLIIMIFIFPFSLIALVVLLFFGFHYSFRGRNSMYTANEAMSKAASAASEFASKVREDFQQ